MLLEALGWAFGYDQNDKRNRKKKKNLVNAGDRYVQSLTRIREISEKDKGMIGKPERLRDPENGAEVDESRTRGWEGFIAVMLGIENVETGKRSDCMEASEDNVFGETAGNAGTRVLADVGLVH
jgi:hypothetical protein